MASAYIVTYCVALGNELIFGPRFFSMPNDHCLKDFICFKVVGIFFLAYLAEKL